MQKKPIESMRGGGRRFAEIVIEECDRRGIEIASIKSTARMLRVSARWVRGLLAQGRLEGVRLRRTIGEATAYVRDHASGKDEPRRVPLRVVDIYWHGVTLQSIAAFRAWRADFRRRARMRRAERAKAHGRHLRLIALRLAKRGNRRSR